jgi:hypothetical protein
MTAYEETLRFCNEKLEKEVAALKAEVKRLKLELQKASKVQVLKHRPVKRFRTATVDQGIQRRRLGQ